MIKPKARKKWSLVLIPVICLLLAQPCFTRSVRAAGTDMNTIKLQPLIKNGLLTLVFTGPDNQKIDYKLFPLNAPPRLVIDFPGSALEVTSDPGMLLSEYTGYSSFRWLNSSDKCRVVLDTEYATLPEYEEKTENGALRVSLYKAPEDSPKVVSQPASQPAPKKKISRPFTADNNPISIDFKGTDIQNVFRFLAEINHLNVVMGDDVSGTVTLRLKNVPWKQVLDIVLRTHQLGMEREGNVVRIAPMEVFLQEEAARQEKARREAESRKTEEAVKPTVIRILKVNFADINDVADKIESTILSDRGTIETDPRTNSIIINDLPDNIDLAAELLRELDEPVRQVMIEAKIVKIHKTSVKALGIQWGGAFKSSTGDRYYGIYGNSNGQDDVGLPTPGDSSFYAVNLPVAAATSGIGMVFGKIDKFALNVKLSAMQSKGNAQVLSNPKVVALNQQEAEIRQGKEIPYQTSSDNTGPTTEFKNADLSLKVTPTITNNNMISMKVTVTKDSKGENTPDAGPVINTQRIDTSLLLKDGETAVIGGILESNRIDANRSVPFFGKIPILGYLFNHDYSDGEQTELMIFISPRIVK
jgi:type IV pilus assembly protein PilQ